MLFTLCTSLPAAIPLSVLSSLSMGSSHHTPQWVPSCTLCVEGMLHILLVLGAPGLDAVLQMGPHKGRIGGDNPRMPLAFQAAGAHCWITFSFCTPMPSFHHRRPSDGSGTICPWLSHTRRLGSPPHPSCALTSLSGGSSPRSSQSAVIQVSLS